jgi:hypothetical protein
MTRGSWLIAAGLVAVAALGYLLWTTTGSSAGDSTAPTEVPSAAAEARPFSAAAPVRGGIRPAPATAKGDARPRGTPPRKVEPAVSLERARRDFSDVLAEIEAVEAEGRRLTQPEYIDLYKRGNEAILPLQQHLDWKVPEEAEELRAAQTDFRAKLQTIEPRATPP